MNKYQDLDKYRFLKSNIEFATHDVKGNYPPNFQLEPIHQEISLKFDLKNKIAEGYVSTTIKANVDNVNEIEFDAIDIDIHSIENVNSWDYDGNKIKLFWEKQFEKNEERIVKINYKVEKPITGMYFSYPDDKYPNRPKYSGTDHETIRARYWLPCIDHPAIRCSVEFSLTSDKKHTILANGRLIKEKNNGDGTKTAFWQQKFPCPSYLITLAIGEFISYKDKLTDAGRGEIPLAYYTTKNYTEDDLKRSFSGTPKFLQWMSKKLDCPLEWDKYYQISTNMHKGAMENISFVAWGDFAILNEKENKEMQRIVDWINVHEMAHSWFGDMIVCNEFSHAWLKESWAVYIEKVFYEDNYGEDSYLYGLYNDSMKYRKESDDKYARPIVTNKYNSSWDMYDSHLYPGGAWRIHMLRKKLGDQIFWKATSDYLNTFKGKNVETIDFRRMLEKHSGQNLEEFFEQWLHSAGYPKLKIKFNFDNKINLSCLKIEQTQEDKKKEIGLFKFNLKIMWETNDGNFKMKNFLIKEKNHSFYFSTEQKPKQIIMDPDYNLLCSLDFNPGTPMLIQQLTSDKTNIISKIQAAKELAKKGKIKGIKAIIETYKKEDFWGIKVEYSKALANSPNFDSIKGLVSLLDNEKNPLVLESLISSMDGVRDSIVFKAMKKYLNLNVEERYYYASAAALKVIGSQRTDEAFNFLLNYQIEDEDDRKSIILSGLYNAIGKIRSKKALDYLVQLLPYGKVPEKAKGSLIQGITEAMVWLEKPIKNKTIEKLADLAMKEDSESNLHDILRGIAPLKEKTCIEILTNMKEKVATQSIPALNRLIKKIGDGKTFEETKKNLQKDIDDLKAKMKKIFARIEELEAETTNS